MKILFVIHDMVLGGAGKQLAMTANGLSLMGHQIFVYTYCDNKLFHQLSKNVVYIPQNPLPQSKFAEYLLSVRNVRKQLKLIKPDIVVSWRSNAAFFVNLAALGLNVKTVFTERNDPYKVTSLAIKIASFFSEFSTGAVFQLENIRKYYKRLYNKSIVIPNPIHVDHDLSTCSDYSKRENIIVHVGRMYIPQKRQDIMLSAFQIFLRTHPNYKLYFLGDGEDFDTVKHLANEMGLGEKVYFWGSIKNVLEIIKNTKILVSTSDFEGIPNVILEAFVVGLPVVATDCTPGGARFLLGNNENGLLAPIGNVQKIAKQMQRIVDDENLAQSFISKGRAKLNDFRPETIFAKWDEYLKNVYDY
ncbi:glycosyltransferase [Fibrobacter sp.]|uniref:glycosyltransferase n=1 Tax=Fibrobacter sp. TaxID=35828 RepID=UPI00386E6717